MTFDEFLAPIGEELFMAGHYGRAPLHLSSAGERLRFGWSRLNELFRIAPHWTDGNIKLILNSHPIKPEFYLDEKATHDGQVRRADPAKIDLFLGMGASLVANSVDEIEPEIERINAMLAQRFAAIASANVYCSFDNIQAFATHYDSHEVFAVQCEGEKRWRLYANRADTPIGHGGQSQAEIDAARGPVAAEVLMKPGDLLYIPRGLYHDAIADQGASLHVTFSVAPRSGIALLPLIEAAMARDPSFRAYLPGPDEDGGLPLRERLDALAQRLAGVVTSPQFAIEVADAQRRVAIPRHGISLPNRPRSDYYARTGVQAALAHSPQGTTLTANGRTLALGQAFAAAEWALTRPAFAVLELDARFPQVHEAARRQMIALLIHERLIQRYDPEL